jgi:meso-butanediol dehydrogenase / (S,S)-butanediol dehydrogenase / diacetyl reductase
MSGQLRGKCILITGGAQGIGRECVRANVRESARVAILDVTVETSEQAVKELSSSVISVHCDVAEGGSVAAAIAKVIEEFSAIDAVHNNAGIRSPSKPLHLTEEEEWDGLLRVNLKSVFWVRKHSYPHLKASRGVILNTASMVGSIGQSDHAAYVANEGQNNRIDQGNGSGLRGRRREGQCGMFCRSLDPMLLQWASEQDNPDEIKSYLDRIHPLGHCPEYDIIADASVFLLSNAARFITGCILPVSGGTELGYRL